MAVKAQTGTADRILAAAERMVQQRGFNAFSYADVAKELGIRKASLHHHYETKAHLGLALLARYRAAFMRALAAIEADHAASGARLEAYVELYRSVLRRKRMCMCGMLAADIATLPKPMRDGVAEFFRENEAWLAAVLEDGRSRGGLAFDGPADSLATFFVSSLEGALLVARGSGGQASFDTSARRLLAGVRVVPAPARRR